jgi:hypothetical protein
MWARTGRITASRMGDLMARLKRGGEAASRRDYRAQLIAERLTGETQDRYVRKEMQFGIEQEPFARTAYEIRTENTVDQVGFIFHPRLDFSGASPDGLIRQDGGLELKCPRTTTHLAYIAAGTVPDEYQEQMLWNPRDRLRVPAQAAPGPAMLPAAFGSRLRKNLFIISIYPRYALVLSSIDLGCRTTQLITFDSIPRQE